MFKENTAYFILALVAIVLIGITIGLQVVILSDQQVSPGTVTTATGSQPNASSDQVQSNGLSQSSGSQAGGQSNATQNGGIQVRGEQVNVGNDNKTATLGDQVAMAMETPTEPPSVIVLDPTSPPPPATESPTATLPPLEPTSTPMLGTQAEQAEGEEAVVDGSTSEGSAVNDAAADGAGGTASETATQEATAQEIPVQEATEVVAAEASPTDTRVAPIPTPTTESDILFGYTDRGRNCTIMTQAVAQLMGQRLGINVATVKYSSANDMITALADQTIDLTLCYLDPDDRQLMREFLGDIRQVGTQHMVGEGYKLQLWANGTSKAQIRDGRPCVLDFLEKVDFTSVNIDTNSLDSFVPVNGATIEQWLDCPYQ